MSLPLAFHPDVRTDVDEAYLWYQERREGLGEDFLAALREVFEQIGRTPELHRTVHRDVRRTIPRRFPYGVFYRVEPDRVEALAVYHSRRDPRGWQSRV